MIKVYKIIQRILKLDDPIILNLYIEEQSILFLKKDDKKTQLFSPVFCIG